MPAFTRCFGGKPPPIRVVRVGLGKYVPPAEDEPTLDVSMVAVAAPKAKRSTPTRAEDWKAT